MDKTRKANGNAQQLWCIFESPVKQSLSRLPDNPQLQCL